MSHSLSYDFESITGKVTARLTNGTEELVIEAGNTFLSIKGARDIEALRLLLNNMARTQERVRPNTEIQRT